VKIYFVSPPEVQMRQDILDHLDEHDVWYDLSSDVGPIAGEVDVIYQTCIRPDRVEDRAALERYTIDGRLLRRMKPDAMILHPLPRTVEIDKAVDDDPRALYFKQATNGLFIRMALLTLLWDHD
jgi:aspartate carbamoyltransferase catalytic subunit